MRALLTFAAFVLISAQLGPGSAAGQPAANRGRGVPPVALTSHTPTEADYPPDSVSRGEQGVVRVRYVVSQTGDVSECQVVGSSGYDRLDGAACVFVGQWKFRPATLRGSAVAAAMRANVVFRTRAAPDAPEPTILNRPPPPSPLRR